MTSADEWLTLSLMAVHSTSISLLLKYAHAMSKDGKFIDGSLFVCIVEFIKLITCLLIQLCECYFSYSNGQDAFYNFVRLLYLEFLNKERYLISWIPALAYAIQNNLFYIAMNRLSVLEYQFGLQLRVLWAAFASKWLLNHIFTRKQWFSLATLIIGVIIIQIGDTFEQESIAIFSKQFDSPRSLFSLLIGWISILAGSFLSGSTSIILEWINHKRAYQDKSKSSIWTRTAQISFNTFVFSVLFMEMAYYINRPNENHKTAFLEIPPGMCNWLSFSIIFGQSIGGMLVAYVSVTIGGIERIFATSFSLILAFVGDRIAFPRPQTSFIMDLIISLGVFMVIFGVVAFRKELKYKGYLTGHCETYINIPENERVV